MVDPFSEQYERMVEDDIQSINHIHVPYVQKYKVFLQNTKRHIEKKHKVTNKYRDAQHY